MLAVMIMILGIVCFFLGIYCFTNLRSIGQTEFFLALIVILVGYALAISRAATLWPKQHMGLWFAIGLPVAAVIIIPLVKLFLEIRKITLYEEVENEEKDLATWFDNIGKK